MRNLANASTISCFWSTVGTSSDGVSKLSTRLSKTT